MIAPTAIIKGLAMSIDIDIIDVEGATGDYNTNFINKGSIFFIKKNQLKILEINIILDFCISKLQMTVAMIKILI